MALHQLNALLHGTFSTNTACRCRSHVNVRRSRGECKSSVERLPESLGPSGFQTIAASGDERGFLPRPGHVWYDIVKEKFSITHSSRSGSELPLPSLLPRPRYEIPSNMLHSSGVAAAFSPPLKCRHPYGLTTVTK